MHIIQTYHNAFTYFLITAIRFISEVFQLPLLSTLCCLSVSCLSVVCSLGFPRPIIKLHPKEKWAWPWGRGAPQNLGFPFNISATTEGSDFKIGMQVGFAKAHHKILSGRKSGRGHGLGELPKFWSSRLIFLQRLKLATSHLVRSLGFPSPIIQLHP